LSYFVVGNKSLNEAYKLDGSLAEVEKLFEVAVNGSDDDNVSAATVLCGATLLRGWNFQVSIS